MPGFEAARSSQVAESAEKPAKSTAGSGAAKGGRRALAGWRRGPLRSGATCQDFGMDHGKQPR